MKNLKTAMGGSPGSINFGHMSGKVGERRTTRGSIDFGTLGNLAKRSFGNTGKNPIGTIQTALDDPNYQVGMNAMQAYYDAASAYPGNFPYQTFQDMLNSFALNVNWGGASYFDDYTIMGLGDIIVNNNVSTAIAASTMQQLAQRGEGMIPAIPETFHNCLTQVAVNANSGFFDGVAFVTAATVTTVASGIATGAQSVGDLAIGGLQIFSSPWLLGAALAAAGGLWLVTSGNYSKFKRSLTG